MYRMSEAPPPTENLSIFNAVDFPGISKGKANFPNLQGVLTASSGIIWGDGSYQNSSSAGGGASTLSQVLTAGNDGGGTSIVNVPSINNLLYIDSTNNRIGINVANPTEDLEIDGNIQLDSSTASKIVFYDKGVGADHEHAEIDAEGELNDGGVIKFQTKQDGSTVGERLRINNIGAIGLGGGNYGTAGQVLTSKGSTAGPVWETIGFRQRLFPANGTTFSKVSYPWLRALKVICVGAGGAGGGTPVLGSQGQASSGSGGSAGSYSERWITDIGNLSSSINITVGAGGTGVSGASGNDGGHSEFLDSTNTANSVYATGGTGGNIGSAAGAIVSIPGVSTGAGSNTGDISVIGGASSGSLQYGSGSGGTRTAVIASNGGNSKLGTGGLGATFSSTINNTVQQNGGNGVEYGGGGGGAGAVRGGTNTTNTTGGDGADGVVILELYA